MFLSIVLPVYNEEKTIKKVIHEHLHALKDIEYLLNDWEMVCVDDASCDQTPEILNQISKEVSQIRIFRHRENRGIYRTYAHLFQEARGTHIYQTATDGQWPADNMVRMMKALVESNFDIVIGVRQNRGEIYSLWRRILSSTFNRLPEILFNVETKDANGIKLGRREIFNFNLVSRSFFAEIERIIKAKQSGYHVGFVPIEFLPRGGGKAGGAKWSNIISTVCDCARYTVYHIFNKQS